MEDLLVLYLGDREQADPGVARSAAAPVRSASPHGDRVGVSVTDPDATRRSGRPVRGRSHVVAEQEHVPHHDSVFFHWRMVAASAPPVAHGNTPTGQPWYAP
ncbi:hypothetical protein Nm8I071_35100 [Nonomuraea sp. TT08I-71]|nr:hypothetical protein Nm8I071_35100 [Nonomuraea sp. TT08I-71]